MSNRKEAKWDTNSEISHGRDTQFGYSIWFHIKAHMTQRLPNITLYSTVYICTVIMLDADFYINKTI
jgi:hypothetical protein